MVNKTSIDELAAEMEAVLNDKNYRSIFERPRIKMASAAQETKVKSVVELAYEQLMAASTALDELGLTKSAELAMEAIETLLSEAATEDDFEDENEDDDGGDGKEPVNQLVRPGEDKPKMPLDEPKASPLPAVGNNAKALQLVGIKYVQ